MMELGKERHKPPNEWWRACHGRVCACFPVNAMLLNEFLKEHRKNEEQLKQINVLTAQLKEQAAQIQKVSAQLETSKPAPQVVNNP